MDISSTRKALGLSQTALANVLGVSQATISRFETGELVPNVRTILALEALMARSKKPKKERAA